MIEVPQWIINWALASVAGVFGWTARTLWGAQQKLTNDVQQLSLDIAKNYVTSHRLENLERALFEKLDRIEDKLDGKADK